MGDNFLRLDVGCHKATSTCHVISEYPVVGLSVGSSECVKGKDDFTCPNGDNFKIEDKGRALQFITGNDALCQRRLTVFVEWTDFDRALAVAEKIEDARGTLSEIAKAMADAKLFDGAVVVAKKIKHAGYKFYALRNITKAMADAKLFDRAVAIAEEIEDAEYKSPALSWIAKAMAKAKLFDRAMAIAEEIKNAREKSPALREIAVAMAETKLLDSQTVRVACAAGR